MEDIGKTIIKGKLRIVTPVHIGGAQEKHLQRGIDYIDTSDGVYFLDEKKLITHFGIGEYSNALVQGKLGDLCKSINLGEYSTKVIKNLSGEIGTDIKSNIKNTLSGKPIIPGSSLKGSLRSVFYNIASNGRGAARHEDEIFGRISEDIFRYMIVNDVEFNGSFYINTKTFNLRNDRGQFAGGWKHELRGNTSSQFNSKGFTFPHEVINTEDIGDFSIVINRQALSLSARAEKVKHNQYTDKIFRGSEADIYTLIQNNTAKYLKAEIDFFTKYETDHSELIVGELNRLFELNKQAPLLRLGLGSGFHAMTGDTHYPNNHKETGIWGDPNERHHDNTPNNKFDRNYLKFQIPLNQRKNREGTFMFKSRKIAFEGSGESLKLYPMGFVQLCSEEVYDNYYKEAFEIKLAAIKNAEIKANEKLKAENAAYEAAKIKAAEDEKKAKEEAEIARLESLKPKFTDPLTLKKAKWVDGLVVGQNGLSVKFKPYITWFEEKIFEIRYPAGLPNDTIIQVMCLSPNGKTLQFQGSPKQKQ